MSNRGLTTASRADDAAGTLRASTSRNGDHDHRGRFATGNKAALVAGKHSAQFWEQASDALQRLRAEIFSDLGYEPANVPRALYEAATALAQATLLRDSAFARLVEVGGPATAKGRRRAVFSVWCESADRAERHLRLIGLARRERPVDPLDAIRRAVADANETAKDGTGNHDATQEERDDD